MELQSQSTTKTGATHDSITRAEDKLNWLTPGKVFWFLGIYFILQTVFPVAVSDSAELDESEQLLFSQSWSWGYGSDPPLYTWLQILCFRLFGINILALALLKNTLLFLAFWFTYRGGAEAAGKRVGLIAALSLLLFPQITWESQRDLTHSVLATAIATATFWVAVRIWKLGKARDYMLLGLCLGLGALSKHSYFLVAAALGAAALTLPPLRQALLRRWMLLAIAILLFITFWHVQWAWLTPERALFRSREVVKSVQPSFVRSRIFGVLSIPKCFVTLGAALCAAYWIAFRPIVFGPLSSNTRTLQRWIWRTFAVSGILSLVVAVGWGIQLRDRWFQPIVFLGGISAALFVQDTASEAAEKRLFKLTALAAAVVLLVLPGIPLVAALTRRPTRLNAPYRSLCARLEAAVSRPEVLLASTRLVGGNLRLSFKDSVILAPEFSMLTVQPNAPVLVVWDATKDSAPSAALVKLVQRVRRVNLLEHTPNYIDAPLLYTSARHMTLAYVPVP